MFVVSGIESAGLSLIPTAPLGGLFCGWSFLSNWAQRHKAFQSVMKADRTVVKGSFWTKIWGSASQRFVPENPEARQEQLGSSKGSVP